MAVEVVQRPRKGGKTTHIIYRWLQDPENSVIVTTSQSEADYLRREMARWCGQGMTPKNFDKAVITIDQIRNGFHHGSPPKKVFIDGADRVLDALLGGTWKLEGISLDA